MANNVFSNKVLDFPCSDGGKGLSFNPLGEVIDSH